MATTVAPAPRAVRVELFTAVLVASTALVAAGPMAELGRLPGSTHVPWAVLALMFYLAEANVVHLHLGRETHSYSLSEIPLVIGLFFVAPVALLAAHLVGAGCALVGHRRQALIKLVFNLAQLAVTTSMAVVTFRTLLGAADATEPRAWTAALVAVSTASLVGAAAVTVVIHLAQGHVDRQLLPATVGMGIVGSLTNTTVGVIAAIVLWSAPQAAWTFIIPAASLTMAYRLYHRQHRQNQALRFLYTASGILQATEDTAVAIEQLLRHTARALRADYVELTLFHGPDPHRSALRDGSLDLMRTVPALPCELVLASIAADRGGLTLAEARALRSVGSCLDDRGLDDGIVVALRSDAEPTGLMVIGNRIDGTTDFVSDEVELATALADQVGVAVEMGRLERSVDELQERELVLTDRTLHDDLTGLANRVLLRDRLEQSLARRSTRPVILLFVDLDDFKLVNDTRGHAAGDVVLQTVAQRIRRCLRPADTAARLGGDEFAVLLDDAVDHTDALVVARRIVDAVHEPIELDDHTTTRVGASIGVAADWPGNTDPAALVDAADAAMYEAKAAGKGTVALHDPTTVTPTVIDLVVAEGESARS